MKMRLWGVMLAMGLMALVIGACQAQDTAPAPAAPTVQAAGEQAAPPAAAEQGKGQRAWLDKLTAEQKKQVMAKLKELHQAKAKPEEVKAALAEMFKGWGLTPPQGQGLGAAQGNRQGLRGLTEKLTAEQKAQLLAKVKELKAANAKPEEIRAAIAELCKGWGVEVGAGQGQGKGAGPQAGKGQRQAWMDKLTDEQKQQVQAKIKELREAGKTREEIHAAVAEMLKGFGVEIGVGQGQGNGQAGGKLKALMAKLTPEQRQELQAKVKALRDAGKTRQEIMAAVQELLKGWGLEGGAAGPQ